MKTFNPDAIIQQRLATCFGLEQYVWLLNTVRNSDVSTNEQFQRTFNACNRVRRNAQWRAAYYRLFEESKQNSFDFERILFDLHKATGNIEASFASKMLACINPSRPIWDRFVVQNVGLEIPFSKTNTRPQETVDAYRRLCQWYDKFLKTKNAKMCIKRFNELLPDYATISDVKKIDCFLWSAR